MVRYLLMLLVLALLCASCARFYGLVETDAVAMSDCALVGTFAETANPGREDGGVLKHYVDTTGVQHRVLQRAAEAGATHVVWMHTYSSAAAAQAYRCPAKTPPVTSAAGPDGIWEEDLP